MYMPSPYTALVRRFLRVLESGDYDQGGLTPILAADAVLHVAAEGEGSVDYTDVEGVCGYLARAREASGGTLEFKPQSFELRDRGAFTVITASGRRGEDEFSETLKVVLGLAGGRVQELWIDPVDRESFERTFGA